MSNFAKIIFLVTLLPSTSHASIAGVCATWLKEKLLAPFTKPETDPDQLALPKLLRDNTHLDRVDIYKAAKKLKETEISEYRNYLDKNGIDFTEIKNRLIASGVPAEEAKMQAFETSQKADLALAILNIYDQKKGTRHAVDQMVKMLREDKVKSSKSTPFMIAEYSNNPNSIHDIFEAANGSETFMKIISDNSMNDQRDWIGSVERVLRKVTDGASTPPKSIVTTRFFNSMIESYLETVREMSPNYSAVNLEKALGLAEKYYSGLGKEETARDYAEARQKFKKWREGSIIGLQLGAEETPKPKDKPEFSIAALDEWNKNKPDADEVADANPTGLSVDEKTSIINPPGFDETVIAVLDSLAKIDERERRAP